MLKTPSKFLQRPFLRDLLENQCLSPRGKEYCEEEVRDLLIEKEQRLALIEQERELSRINREAKESWVFQIDKLRNFHDQLINPGILRGPEKPCQHVSHCELSQASIIFPLPENISLCEDLSTTATPSTERLQKLDGVQTHHQPSIAVAPGKSGAAAFAERKGKKMHKFPGKPMTEQQVEKELAEIDDFLENGALDYFDKQFPVFKKLKGKNGQSSKPNRRTST